MAIDWVGDTSRVNGYQNGYHDLVSRCGAVAKRTKAGACKAPIRGFESHRRLLSRCEPPRPVRERFLNLWVNCN